MRNFCNLTHLQEGGYKGKIQVKILEKIYVGSLTEFGSYPKPDPKPSERSDPDSKKIIPDPQHWTSSSQSVTRSSVKRFFFLLFRIFFEFRMRIRVHITRSVGAL
jgi:hypothetical protein